eukprot:scaffold7340_cov266-Pinguiococcus_pyrenoidosus.AAC.13
MQDRWETTDFHTMPRTHVDGAEPRRTDHSREYRGNRTAGQSLLARRTRARGNPQVCTPRRESPSQPCPPAVQTGHASRTLDMKEGQRFGLRESGRGQVLQPSTVVPIAEYCHNIGDRRSREARHCRTTIPIRSGGSGHHREVQTNVTVLARFSNDHRIKDASRIGLKEASWRRALHIVA